MKAMKRFISLAAAFVLCLTMLTACGGDKYSDSPYLGTWAASQCNYGGFTLDVADIYDGGFDITLNADGTAEVKLGEESDTGSWEPTDNGIKISDSSDELELVKDKDGNLCIESEGATITFTLKK